MVDDAQDITPLPDRAAIDNGVRILEGLRNTVGSQSEITINGRDGAQIALAADQNIEPGQAEQLWQIAQQEGGIQDIKVIHPSRTESPETIEADAPLVQEMNAWPEEEIQRMQEQARQEEIADRQTAEDRERTARAQTRAAHEDRTEPGAEAEGQAADDGLNARVASSLAGKVHIMGMDIYTSQGGLRGMLARGIQSARGGRGDAFGVSDEDFQNIDFEQVYRELQNLDGLENPGRVLNQKGLFDNKNLTLEQLDQLQALDQDPNCEFSIHTGPLGRNEKSRLHNAEVHMEGVENAQGEQINLNPYAYKTKEEAQQALNEMTDESLDKLLEEEKVGDLQKTWERSGNKIPPETIEKIATHAAENGQSLDGVDLRGADLSEAIAAAKASGEPLKLGSETKLTYEQAQQLKHEMEAHGLEVEGFEEASRSWRTGKGMVDKIPGIGAAVGSALAMTKAIEGLGTAYKNAKEHAHDNGRSGNVAWETVAEATGYRPAETPENEQHQREQEEQRGGRD